MDVYIYDTFVAEPPCVQTPKMLVFLGYKMMPGYVGKESCVHCCNAGLKRQKKQVPSKLSYWRAGKPMEGLYV
jgi:hypothetical protein